MRVLLMYSHMIGFLVLISGLQQKKVLSRLESS